MKKIIMAIASTVLACGIGFAAVGCGAELGAISVYNRESGSGTRDAFVELIGIAEEDLIGGAAQHSSTGAVLNAVADDINGIGYISLGSLDDSVKALTIDGVAPSAAAVADGSYKVARPFEIMYQQENYDENDLLRDFLTFLQSAQAQEIINDYGYVSIHDDAPEYVAPEAAFTTTTLDIGGSTSVQPLMGVDEDDVNCLVTTYKELCGQNVTINVGGGGSGTGITNSGNGTLDIGMASSEVTQDSFENPTGTMVIYQLCSDGIAIIVNNENPVNGLTVADLVDIYTGEVTDWSAYTSEE